MPEASLKRFHSFSSLATPYVKAHKLHEYVLGLMAL